MTDLTQMIRWNANFVRGLAESVLNRAKVIRTSLSPEVAAKPARKRGGAGKKTAAAKPAAKRPAKTARRNKRADA